MASLVEVQQQLLNSHEQIRSLSQEIAAANNKLTYLDNDRAHKEQAAHIQSQRVASLEDSIARLMQSGAGHVETQIKLIDLKTMAPKKFSNRPEEIFKSWATDVRSHCNAARPGFRKFLKWVEAQTEPINDHMLASIDWRYKQAASEVMSDFLIGFTAGEVKCLVELQDYNGLEAWRRVVLQYDPIGESYVIDQMASLMEVRQCSNLTELPAAINKWERMHINYQEKSGGNRFPDEWRIPILMKMIPKANIDEVKLKHKYAQGVDKTYAGFTRILIELANEKRYDNRNKTRGKDDMDVDALARQKREDQRQGDDDEYGPADEDDDEYDEEECREYADWLQEEISWLGAKGKGKKGKGKGKGKGPTGPSSGKGGSADFCLWCKRTGHLKADCREFAKWKDDKDKQRAKDGKPPCVPYAKKKPMDLLQLAEE